MSQNTLCKEINALLFRPFCVATCDAIPPKFVPGLNMFSRLLDIPLIRISLSGRKGMLLSGHHCTVFVHSSALKTAHALLVKLVKKF